MKSLWLLFGIAVVFLWAQCTDGLAAPLNGSKKFDFGTGSSPPVFGSTYDEIVVQSNLNVRGKNPSSRSQRTRLHPVSQSSTAGISNATADTSTTSSSPKNTS